MRHQRPRKVLLALLVAPALVAACSDGTSPSRDPRAALADSLERIGASASGMSLRGLALISAAAMIRSGAPVGTLTVTDSAGSTRDYRAVIASYTTTFPGSTTPPELLRELIAWQGTGAEHVVTALTSSDTIAPFEDAYSDSTPPDTAAVDTLMFNAFSDVVFSDPLYDWMSTSGGGALQLLGEPSGACASLVKLAPGAQCANAQYRVGLDFTLEAIDSAFSATGATRVLSTHGTLAGLALQAVCDANCQASFPGPTLPERVHAPRSLSRARAARELLRPLP